MAKEFVVVFKDPDGDMKTHFYPEQKLYDFLNKNMKDAAEGMYDEDSGELIQAYVVLDKVPCPPDNWAADARQGEFCISAHWPENGILILEREAKVSIESRSREKIVTVTEYGPPPTPKRTRSAKKATTKRSRK
jgi:hypothetical protein